MDHLQILPTLPPAICIELIAVYHNIFCVLYFRELNDQQSRVKVGFVTYSNHLHFYNIKVG